MSLLPTSCDMGQPQGLGVTGTSAEIPKYATNYTQALSRGFAQSNPMGVPTDCGLGTGVLAA
jgi:hypothetical protein